MNYKSIYIQFCLFFFIINHINSKTIWNIIIYDENNSPNNITIIKGNYKTIHMEIKQQNENIFNDDDINLNATLKLNHQDLNILPNEIYISTEQSTKYTFDLGVKCKINSDNINFNFYLEDTEGNNITELLGSNEFIANLKDEKKKIDYFVLNKDGITNNLFGKIYVNQNIKNFQKINIDFSIEGGSCFFYLQTIKSVTFPAYDGNIDTIPFYHNTSVKIKEDLKDKEIFYCNISASINSQCFIIDDSKIELKFENRDIELGNKEIFYHNSIVSSYLDNTTNNENNSLNLIFYKEVPYLASFCAIQDINSILISNYEILNQRLNNSNKYNYNGNSFLLKEFNQNISEPQLIFNNLEVDQKYKIKCIFDFFDDSELLELTYGEGMLIPVDINFNKTKTILQKNCENNEKILDTRYCDVVERRLIFPMFYDTENKYKLKEFNYTDFLLYSEKDNKEKIKYIKRILSGNITILSSENENELVSTLSDYLFLINFQSDNNCQLEKDLLFKEVLYKYHQINANNINIKNDAQSIINDVLLFNNIIQNTDSINYENFETLVNKVLYYRNEFFANSIREYNYYLTNYFLLIFDKLIYIVNKFKIIDSNKFKLDKKLNIYKNELVIKFFNYFINWISDGIINREDRLLPFCRTFIFNYIETPVESNIDTIIDTDILTIKGFNTKQSKSLYKDIYSAGAFSYKEFPLFPKDRKDSEVTTLFLYTELRENFINDEISYSEAFKIIFKKKSSKNYCYLWNNDYLEYLDKSKNNIVNNYISTEYLDKDKNSKYNINCISRVMISPMTVILGPNDIKGSLFKEGINFLSVLLIVVITLSLIVLSFPFILSQYYKKRKENPQQEVNIVNELN